MVSLTWLPEVKHKIVQRLRKGTLRPKRNNEAYQVPPPYSVNVAFTNRDGSTSIIPIVAEANGGTNAAYKNNRGQPLRTQHHHVDLGFSFTDYKIQGLTFKKGEKLIVVLNKQTAPIDIRTISVCLSRVTCMEDVRIFPIMLSNPDEIKHLLRLKNDRYTAFWESGYTSDGWWDATRLRSLHRGRIKKIQVQFAEVELDKLIMDGKNGLRYY